MMVMVVVVKPSSKVPREPTEGELEAEGTLTQYLKDWDHQVSTSQHIQIFMYRKEDQIITPSGRLGMGSYT